MLISELLEGLFELFPADTAEPWDHVGLSVGRPDDGVRGVTVALDASEANVRRAAADGSNVLLTHHPVYIKAPQAFVPASPAYPSSAAAVFAAVAGTAGLLYHLGREDKRKAAFLDKRRREAEEYAERVCDALRQELAVVREDLGKAYEFEVKRGFAPALESLFHQSVHLRLFLDVMQKIRSDVSRYDTHVQKQLEQLGGVLER